MLPRLSPFVIAAAFLNASWAAAEDLLPADQSIGVVVDHYIDATLEEKGVAPAPQVNAATLIRRFTLDLVGQIPTPAETKAYVESTDADKRGKLIERPWRRPARPMPPAIGSPTARSGPVRCLRRSPAPIPLAPNPLPPSTGASDSCRFRPT